MPQLRGGARGGGGSTLRKVFIHGSSITQLDYGNGPLTVPPSPFLHGPPISIMLEMEGP